MIRRVLALTAPATLLIATVASGQLQPRSPTIAGGCYSFGTVRDRPQAEIAVYIRGARSVTTTWHHRGQVNVKPAIFYGSPPAARRVWGANFRIKRADWENLSDPETVAYKAVGARQLVRGHALLDRCGL